MELMAILNPAKRAFLYSLVVFLGGCNSNRESDNLFTKSEKVIGKVNYFSVYNSSTDTIDVWVANKFNFITTATLYPYKLDSLLCFNSSANRLVSCIHFYIKEKNSNSDGLKFLYGEKINDKWYFYLGPFIVIPRSMVKDHEGSIPLSYQQLHEIALKEVYRGYLKNNCEINEEWFTSQFEHVGICPDCKTREDYQKNILGISVAMWANRDTTQPIKHLREKALP